MEILWHHTLGLAPVGCGHTTYGVVSSFVVVVVSSVVVCSPRLLAHVCHRAPASCTRRLVSSSLFLCPSLTLLSESSSSSSSSCRSCRRRRADLAVALCALVVHSTNAFSSWWAQCWRLDASYLLAHAVVGLDLDLPATYVSPYMTPPPKKGALP